MSASSTPSRSKTPGRNPSSTTSASATTPGTGSVRASQVRISLPAFRARYHSGGVRSPSGGSILTTRRRGRSSSRLAIRPGQLAREVHDRRCRRARASARRIMLRAPDGRPAADLLDAAVRVFARKGFQRRASVTSPRKPASRTGCSTTTSARRTRCSRRSSARRGSSSSTETERIERSDVPLQEQLRGSRGSISARGS